MSVAGLFVRSATVPGQGTNMRCVSCGGGFDFAAGQHAEILRHVAYGFGLAYEGASPLSQCERVHNCGVNSGTDFGVRQVGSWRAVAMFVIKRSPTMFRSIKRRFTAVALAGLPLVVLILSAAPDGCSGGCPADDLSAPTTAIVVSSP